MGDELTDIGLLGPVTAHAGGVALDLGGAQRRAVLTRLALTPGAVVTQAALVDGLWHEPPGAARKVVQVHISRLRAVLPADVVVTAGGGYLLDVDPGVVDADRFERQVSAGRAAADRGDLGQAIDLLCRAEDLWRGPALADVGDVPFAAAATARLDEARMEGIEIRLAAELDSGLHAASVPELEALVRQHPLRERLWVHLMTALNGSGRRADALRAYERARHQLADVGLSPGPGLKDQDRVLLEDDARESASPRPARRPASPPRLIAPTLLVGRLEERRSMQAALVATRVGQGPGLVAARGEEGLGKSSLIATFVADPATGSSVLVGRCRQHVAVPFGPWTKILEQLGADDVIDFLASGIDLESAEARRVRLFSDTVDRLRAATDHGPVVIVLDDLHWADDGTISLLLHVLAETEGLPLLVVGAWRAGDITVGRPAVHLADAVARGGCLVLDLVPLTVDEIAEMLGGHAPEVGGDQRRETAARLLEVTSGVPLFVADAVGAMSEGRRGLATDVMRARVPETARSIVARRLTEAGSHAVPVVEATAVLGEAAEPDVLAGLIGAPPATVAIALDDLARVGLLRDSDAGPRFTHAAFRAAVVESAPKGRLQVLHAGAFDLLTEGGAGATALAHHADGAGPLLGAEVASSALARAGSETARRGAFADAARWYESASHCAPVGRQAAQRVAWADAQWRSGDISAAKLTAGGVIRDALADGLPASHATLVDAAVLHSTVGAGFGPDPESIGLIDALLADVKEPLLIARLRVAAAYHHATWGSVIEDAHAAVDAARRSLPSPCPPALKAELAFAEALALLDEPDVDRRLAGAEDLVGRARATDSLRDLGRGLRVRAMAELATGDRDAVRRSVDELEGVAAQTASWMYEADVWRWRGTLALAEGEIDELADCVARQDRIAKHPLAGWAYSGTQHILLARERGEYDLALAMVDTVREVVADTRAGPADRTVAELYRLDLLHHAGRQDQATEELIALEPWRDIEATSCRHYPCTLALAARAMARAAVTGPAPDILRRLEPFGDQQIVLGWGEGLLGTFVDAHTQLADATGRPARAGPMP